MFECAGKGLTVSEQVHPPTAERRVNAFPANPSLRAPVVDINAPQARCLSQRQFDLAHISEYSIVTYERKPGQWRAAVTRKVGTGAVRGDKVLSIVTPDDYGSESEAELAAEKLIKKL
jgi:hypothetical protein